MVSYCNVASVQAMFGARGPPYHPHHHSPPQHYFGPSPYPAAPPPPSAPPPPPSMAYSQAAPQPPQPSHLQNFSSPHHPHYESQWQMTPTPTESPPTAWSATPTASCVRGYDDWHYPHHHPMMGSFYPHHFSHHHQQQLPSQPSPPTTSSSTPSPPPTFNTPFKTEFGPCSANHERSSSEVGGAPAAVVPHSPDSGMAISDGVSSSGSPHIPQPSSSSYNNSCLAASSTTETHHNYSSGPMTSSAVHRPAQARSPYEWMKKPSYAATTTVSGGSTHSSSSNAKTRTKDKYRVVYSDTQRLELEKEFHYSRYITIRRKSELASILGLSERQVKIWFQNRRAKERKIVRKREELMNREKIQSMAVQFGGMM